MSNTRNWFGSDERSVHCKAVSDIPFWRRFLLALLSYRTWRNAVALGRAAVFVGYTNENADMFDRLVSLSDTEWSKVFNLPDRAAEYRNK